MKTNKQLFFFALSTFVLISLSLSAESVIFVTNNNEGNRDQSYYYIRDYCISNGYDVHIIHPSDPALSNLYATANLLIVGPQAAAAADTITAFMNVVGSNPYKPIIFCKGEYMVSYNITTRTGFNSTTGYQMTIINTDHPLAAGKSGVVEVYDFPQGVEEASGNNDKNVYYLRDGEIPASAVIIGTNEARNRIALCGFETGSTMLNGVVNNNRIVFFYFTPWTRVSVCVFNTHTDELWDATVYWALEGTPLLNNLVSHAVPDYRINEDIIEWDSNNVNVIVYDSTGKKLFNKLITTNTLNMNNFESGLYIIKAYDNQTQKAGSFKFLKN
jgi:hypothetical protein